jgi:hypothetical protein
MASEQDKAAAEAQEIAHAQTAATKRAAVAWWYWGLAGAGVGYVGFALSSGNFALSIAALLVIGVGSPLINAALTRVRGIRVTSVIGSAAWLFVPYVVLIGGVYLLTFTVMKASGQWWPGIPTATIAIVVTVAFGLGVERVRRYPEDMGR